MLLLPRELLLFDTALGAPVSSTVLPAQLSAFNSLLGVYGSGVCQGGGDEGGVDFLYTLHTGGWVGGADLCVFVAACVCLCAACWCPRSVVALVCCCYN